MKREGMKKEKVGKERRNQRYIRIYEKVDSCELAFDRTFIKL